jgi:hypothetical protein
MKSAVLLTLITSLSLSASNAFAEGTCHSGGGTFPGEQFPGGGNPGTGPVTPHLGNGAFPTTAQVQQFLSQAAAGVASPAAAAPAAPQARIRVVDPSEANSDSNKTAAATNSGGVRIRVVSDDLPSDATSEPKPVIADAEPETIDEGLKELVGNWTAVARVGDNELTTVELQLDDRGWATLTLPGKDGKKSTIKRRVELENDELQLKGPNSKTLLGKLVSFNSRQMVLEKAGGQVTFVRI